MSNPLTDLADPCIDKFVYLADQTLNIVSVFDDLRYDRADVDIMSVGMRKHAIKKLVEMGFEQRSGTVLTHDNTGTSCHIPKFHALGASPFDSVRYTNKPISDYYLLTPTQTACRLIDHYPEDTVVERLEQLISKQPVNLYRIMDFVEKDNSRHKHYLEALGYLLHFQRTAIMSEPLRSMRALQ